LYHFLQQGALDVENSKTSLVYVVPITQEDNYFAPKKLDEKIKS
jgi:hypothetical protein